MFRGKALDAIILSILNAHTEGFTGYALVKEIARTFHPMSTPGTGTIYPRLKKLAADEKNKHLTLLALAYDSGFNSKSAFNLVFKKQTGETPSQFLRTMREEVQ